MNKNGQVGMIVMTAVAIIVGLVLLIGQGGIAGNVATMTATPTLSLQSISLAVVPTALSGREIVTIEVTNKSTGAAIDAGNYTITNNIVNSSAGTLYCSIQTSAINNINGTVNATYTYYPVGSPKDSASRSILGVIVILCAMAILVIAIIPTTRNEAIGILGMK